MMVAERVLEKRLHRMTVYKIQFGYMPKKEQLMLFLPLEHCKKSIVLDKDILCIVDLEKTFDRVQREILKWAMRKKLKKIRLDQ